MGLIYSKSTPRFVITGPPNPWGEGVAPPKRLNIVDFVKDERMFSLYVQALQEMYRAGEDDVCSYFQLASIHGMPYVPWNGHASKTPAGTFRGYCVHRTSLFPTWHRPYILAFEQVLQSHAARIAEEYTTETTEWRQAAAELRQPFWDWAASGQAVPPDEIIRLSKIVIRAKPDGKPTEVDNPFLAYTFKSILPGCIPPFDKWTTTLRYPKNNQSDPDAFARALSANQESLTSQTYFLFTLLNTWPEFSNARAELGGNPATSLEGIHNTIHDLSGGGGHTGEISVAAFDPIFYMLHANTDRCLSLWAALHPDVWVTEDHQVNGTFAFPDNATIDARTPLFPFPNSQDTYWTSHGSTDTARLRYTYPEFDGLDMNDRDAVQKHIGEIVSKLYTPRYLATSLSPADQPAAAGTAVPTTTTTTPGAHDCNLTIWEWSARVRAKQSELAHSFHVLIFLGSVPEDPREWASAPTYVGAFSAFVNGSAARCANCQVLTDVVTEGYVHLDDVLSRNSRVCSFDPCDVRPYLKDDLDWRVQMADGTPIPLERLPSLEVTVVALQLSMRVGDALPTPVGEPVLHVDITFGRVGGARPE
ncbi:photo-regulated tyrosinase [Ganoderma leucocontextum]|nr:photo-regulated tyrosinase [Ganoderma leucocontextum]